VLRAVYGRLGPLAAARLDRPWRADLAYLPLKPLEWLARAITNAQVARKPGEGVRQARDLPSTSGAPMSM
jgi:hypothetical protein